MPNYKVVNADQLDSDITTVANAIRAKAGTSGKMAFPNGMADAVRSIPSGGGAELPELDNPAFPEDMVSGKALYDHSGKKVDGAVKEVSTVYTTPNQKATMEFDDDWKVSNALEEDVLLRKGTAVDIWLSQSFFGNAKPTDVRKGVTFTAGSYLRKEGEMESDSGGGGGMVVKTGTVTGTGAAQSIDTGLSSIKYFVVSTKSITAVGLVNLIVNADTVATAQAYCVYCSSKSQYISTVLSGYGSSYFTITGGVITVGSGSNTNPANGVQYDWFAFGT